MEFVQWFFGEFIPFGDLVSDVALVLTLPRKDAINASQSDGLYRFMRWLLWVGTIISSIPEIALFIGICVGILVSAILGPATCSTGGKGMDVLMGNVRATKSLVRYVLSESKTITRFILHLVKDVPPGWSTAVILAVRYMFFAPLYPITYPIVRLWGSIKPKPVIKVQHGPGGDLEESRQVEAKDIAAKEGPEPWYGPLVFVQVVAGLMTEVSSIFFAVSTGNILSIASATFGLYCLSVSTLVAILEGPKSTPKSLPQKPNPESVQDLRDELCSDRCMDVLEGVGITILCIFTIVCGLGLASLPFVGVYVVETGNPDTGRILIFVGLGVCGFATLCFCLKDITSGLYFVFFAAGMSLVGVGIVYAVTAGFTPYVIALFIGGGLVLLIEACLKSNC